MKKVAVVLAAASVERIPHDRVAEVFEVDADLVGASGFWHAGDERQSGIRGQHAVVRGGLPAAFADSHFLPVDGMPGDGGLDRAVRHAGFSFDEGEVGFFDRARGKLGAEFAVGGVSFCDGEASAGLFVEAVDDAGALDPADPAEVAAVVEEGVDQRAGEVASTRMDDESGRLVHHEDGIVLEEDVDRDWFWSGRGGGKSGGEGHLHAVAIAEDLRGLRRAAIHQHVALANERLQSHAREVREGFRQKVVEAATSGVRRDRVGGRGHIGFCIAGERRTG